MAVPPTKPPSSGGIHVGDVGGNVSFSALGDIVAGDKVTSFTTIVQVSVEAVTQRKLITASPYRGLDRFEDRDKDLFFGRDQIIKSLLAELSTSNILLVLGASGSGKSSVVRAGLLPTLSTLVGPSFRYFPLVPDVNPFESLRSALQFNGFSQAQTRELLDAQPDAALQLIRGLQREGDQWLIFVDQFEEIFRVSDERLRTNFISALVKIAQDATGSTKLVLAMRSDFFDRLGSFPEFAKLIEKNIKVVTDMQVDELRLAIEQPAAQHGVVFEQGLVEEIIKDVQGQAGSLPLLQYTLSLLWQEEEHRNGLADRHLKKQTYRQLGGVRGALQKRADEIYASFSDSTDPKSESAKQKIVREIFLRVVDIGGTDSEDGPWRPVRRRVVEALFKTPQEQNVLQKLIDEKLLVSSGGQDADATVEVAHEALFTSWERLKQWIEGGKQVIFVRNRLADDARRWQSLLNTNQKGADDELLFGSRLAQALEMRARGDFDTILGGLPETETQFLDASAAHRERRRLEEQERQQRELAQVQALAEEQKKRADDQAKAAARQRWLTRAMVGVSVVALVAAVFSFFQRGAAKKAASGALVSVARYSQESGKNAQALAYLAQALRLNAENREASGLMAAVLTQLSWYIPFTVPMRHYGIVNSAQFSHDGQRVVTASDDTTARIWDATSGKPIGEPMKHYGIVNSAQFSPDGQRVVTASDDTTARIWDAVNGKPLGEPIKHDHSVISAQFSPDGRRLVTACWDGKARVWDAATGKPLGEPMKHEAVVNSAQFSPDGQRVVTASDDTTARIWDATSGKPIGEPMKHEYGVNSAQFSPDGQRVVTTSYDNTAQVWDATSGKPVGEPMQHKELVRSAEFSPDGQRVVTASDDKTVRIWDATSGKPLGEPIKHEAAVNSAQFSPDGQRVVTASDDKTARIFDATSGKPLGEPMRHKELVRSAEFSPDGQLVVIASDDSTARIWDVATGKPIGEPMKHKELVRSAEFSPDGQRVVTASDDSTARIWDATSGTPIGEPIKHEAVVNSAQFSPDGQRVVTASKDKTARIWDAANGKPLGEPLKHYGIVNSAQFSPDGQRVVTASDDKTARIWDAANGKPIGEPMKHDHSVISAQFSPDGRRIVTACWDGKARLWDAANGKPIGEPMKHDHSVISAQFSPDGRRVVTASWDKIARLWDAADGKPLGEPLRHEDFVISAQFSPDGQRVVTASWDNTARLWDAANGNPIGEPMKHEAGVHSAQFSPDGQRVVTASDDKTAQIWDAASGKPLGEPMKHEDVVYSAQFGPDGQRVLTASGDKAARVWDTVIVTDKDTNGDILLLAELAEATGGATLETLDFGQVLAPEQDEATRRKIAAKYAGVSSGLTSLQRWLKWSVSDHKSRTISPFLQLTVSEWLENRITEGTVDGLRVAIQMDPANARVTAHLGRRLADQALKGSADPDEARRARAEADFLTSRALQLAPDSDEVKKLRDEVVELLKGKTN